MPFRRRSHSMVRRPRRRTTWAKFSVNDPAPAPGVAYDLLASWKIANGITILLPGITIGRLHLKISVNITLAAHAAQDAVAVAVALADPNDISGGGGTVNDPVAQPYDQSFMVWDMLHVNKQVMAGGIFQSPDALYESYDVKSKRKLPSQNQTLVLYAFPRGNAVMTSFAFQGQALLLLP